MKSKALKLIEQYDMLKVDGLITVAFSGGADSVALLYLMYELFNEYEFNLQAVHINHMLRGEDSDNDEAFCREFCKKYGIKFYSEKIDINKIAEDSGRSIEETARDVRYKTLNVHTQNGKIATAHTLSDSIETVIFNLTRGSGLKGLTGIPVVRKNIIRPLLTSSRADIEEYCKINKLEYCTDATNFENDYNRNKIRNLVIPVLKEINPSIEETIKINSQIIKADNDYLDKIADDNLTKLRLKDGYNKQDFLKLEYPIASRILIKVLREFNIEVSNKRINYIYTSLINESGKIQLENNCYFIFDKNNFNIVYDAQKKGQPILDIMVEKQKITENSVEIIVGENKKLVLKLVDCKEIENIEKFYPQGLKNLLNYAKIDLLLKLRNRESHDRITFSHRDISKSLKKLFSEDGLEKSVRDSLVVIQTGDKLVWVEDYGVDKAFLVDHKTDKAVYVTIIKVSD